MAHYNKFSAKASINKKDLVFTDVTTPSACASYCDYTVKLTCKSFNYCPNSNLCYLSERHFDDGSLTQDSVDLSCDHYSSKFFFFFLFENKQK